MQWSRWDWKQHQSIQNIKQAINQTVVFLASHQLSLHQIHSFPKCAMLLKHEKNCCFHEFKYNLNSNCLELPTSLYEFLPGLDCTNNGMFAAWTTGPEIKSQLTSTGNGSYRNFLKKSFFELWHSITALPEIKRYILTSRDVSRTRQIKCHNWHIKCLNRGELPTCLTPRDTCNFFTAITSYIYAKISFSF